MSRLKAICLVWYLLSQYDSQLTRLWLLYQYQVNQQSISIRQNKLHWLVFSDKIYGWFTLTLDFSRKIVYFVMIDARFVDLIVWPRQMFNHTCSSLISTEGPAHQNMDGICEIYNLICCNVILEDSFLLYSNPFFVRKNDQYCMYVCRKWLCIHVICCHKSTC